MPCIIIQYPSRYILSVISSLIILCHLMSVAMVWKSCHGVICVCAGTGEGQGLAAERDREGAEISRNAGEAEHVPGTYNMANA